MKHCPGCSCAPRLDPAREHRGPDTEAKCWLMFHGDGLPVSEIAKILDIKVDWVRDRIRRVSWQITRPPRMTDGALIRMSAAGCFDGLRRNGASTNGSHPDDYLIPPQ